MSVLIEPRRAQMVRAFRWSGILFLGFLTITHQVIIDGPLIKIDKWFHGLDHPQFQGLTGFIIRRLDDLGLRSVTAVALLIAAFYIARRFKTWRPLNLAILSLISLNLVVGFFKFWLGRTKPKVGIDLLHFGGMSYPSGHASNAHVDRYQGRLASAGVATISLTVCVVSLVRDTHWFSDLLGGLFIGGALLVLVIAIDRYWPSNSQLS
jgi:hypothetical protein